MQLLKALPTPHRNEEDNTTDVRKEFLVLFQRKVHYAGNTSRGPSDIATYTTSCMFIVRRTL